MIDIRLVFAMLILCLGHPWYALFMLILTGFISLTFKGLK